jgi:hypothetical protein
MLPWMVMMQAPHQARIRAQTSYSKNESKGTQNRIKREPALVQYYMLGMPE